MAKSLLKLKARELRKRGISVRKIAQVLDISKSTTSEWVRDVILTVEQLEVLKGASLEGAALGRIKGAFIQKQRRLQLIEDMKRIGTEQLAGLTTRELLIAGVALYWGEGSKKSNRGIGFCNSDPEMIKFFLLWLKGCFGIEMVELRCKVGINIIHIKREEIVKKYWSEFAGIPLEQFRKTSLKRVVNKKIYENFNQHYGTLTIEVAKSWNLYYRVLGLIEGLRRSLWQGSSVVERFTHNEEIMGSIPIPATNDK